MSAQLRILDTRLSQPGLALRAVASTAPGKRDTAPAGLARVANGTTAGAERWETFDLLRALAAALVFAYHYGTFANPRTNGQAWLDNLEWVVSKLGPFGTNLLLLVCGLFIAKSVARTGFRYGEFLTRRGVRIYAPYALVIGLESLFVCLVPSFSKPGFTGHHGAELLGNLLLWPGLFPDRPALTVAWALSWIVASYVLLPPPLRMLRTLVSSWRGRAAVLLGIVVGYEVFACLSGQMPARLGYILAGCVVSELASSDCQALRQGGRLRWILPTVALGAGAGQIAWNSGTGLGHGSAAVLVSHLLGLAAASALALAAVTAHYRISPRRDLSPLGLVRKFGRTGYSFYLLHGPVAKLFAFVVFPRLALAGAGASAYWALLPVCFLLAATASTLMFLAVEQPVQRAVQRMVTAPWSRGGSLVRTPIGASSSAWFPAASVRPAPSNRV